MSWRKQKKTLTLVWNCLDTDVQSNFCKTQTLLHVWQCNNFRWTQMIEHLFIFEDIISKNSE